MTDTSQGAPSEADCPTHPVAGLQQVLAAVADPVRLEMVRRLGTTLEPVACGALYDDISKSTASHHFKILREAGLTERSITGGRSCQRLRLAEVDAVLPGVLPAILGATVDA